MTSITVSLMKTGGNLICTKVTVYPVIQLRLQIISKMAHPEPMRSTIQSLVACSMVLKAKRKVNVFS